MKNPVNLTFLGTCAANFSPLLKTEYKDKFGLDARRSACARVGKSYMIDCGLYVLESMRIAGVNAADITDIFVTHTHLDHFDPEKVKVLAEGRQTPLRLWVRRDAVLPEIPGTEVIHMEQFKEYEVEEGFTLKAVDANHDSKSFPQHFVMTINGKKLMYATDGAWFLEDSFVNLKKAGLDYLIIDATCGDYVGDYRMASHNSIPMIRLMLPSLLKYGIITEDTTIYLTHIAPSLHAPHEEIVENVAKDGLLVAYDGLTITI